MRRAIVQGHPQKNHHTHLHGYIYEILMSVGVFIRKNVVMTVAFAAAFITSMIVTPDAKYLYYFDFKTLTCLFCVLAVVCALKNVNFFYIIAQKIVRLFGNIKVCILALVYITFIGSMLIANDMALLTFLPLGYFVFSSTGKTKHMAFTFIMQNIAANLVSIFSCQFTENYSSLLVGVNIGGAGTLIASLASLITFREYSKHNPDKKKSYIILFSLFNFGFVIVLTIIMKLFGNT